MLRYICDMIFITQFLKSNTHSIQAKGKPPPPSSPLVENSGRAPSQYTQNNNFKLLPQKILVIMSSGPLILHVQYSSHHIKFSVF
jgi:hypothetical protein